MRVRTDSGWTDATVRNLSKRGMKLHCLEGLQRNQFVEVARGQLRVIGRVVWNDGRMCGVHARETVDIPGLIDQRPARASFPAVERRRSPRAPIAGGCTADRALNSRLLGRAIERAFIVLAIAGMGGFAVATAYAAAAAPIQEITRALAAR